jgi:hypothetical protein
MVEIFNWDIVEFLPALHAATALIRPVKGLLVGVFLDSCVTCVPINTILDAFDIGISKDVVGVRPTLREA